VFLTKTTEEDEYALYPVLFPKRWKIGRAFGAEKSYKNIEDLPYGLYSASQPPQGRGQRDLRPQDFSGGFLARYLICNVDGMLHFV